MSEGAEEDRPVTTIESACLQCFKQGVTRLLFTHVPFFRDVVVMSFECEHCGYKNNEIQADNSREEYGVKLCVNVQNERDMSRAVVKGTHATFSLPDLDFDIPPNTQTGVVSNIEGIISTAVNGLELFQSQRLTQHPEMGAKVQLIINKLKNILNGKGYPFLVCVDDPAGNSHIESLTPPKYDAQMNRTEYTPSPEQLHMMGFFETETAEGDTSVSDDKAKELDTLTHADVKTQNVDREQTPALNLAHEAVEFDALCPHCNSNGRNSMCEINVPGFRTCILMAFSCPNCGAKTSEIRPSGAIGEKGCRWQLEVHTQEDLNRDVIKSDYCSIIIPSLDFEMLPGSQGAFLTTVEGLLTQIADHLDKSYPFTGDSSDKSVAEVSRYKDTIDSLRKLTTDAKMRPFELILDDAADQSMIGARTKIDTYQDDTIDKTVTDLNDPDSTIGDKCLKRIFYERTEEQNDDLGLKDMKTENY